MAYHDKQYALVYNKAKARAQARLQVSHPDEYHEYLVEEMQKLGFEWVAERPAGHRGGRGRAVWVKISDG